MDRGVGGWLSSKLWREGPAPVRYNFLGNGGQLTPFALRPRHPPEVTSKGPLSTLLLVEFFLERPEYRPLRRRLIRPGSGD